LNADRTNLWLRLHGTVESDNYQWLSTTNLLNTNWDLGEIIFWADGDQDDFPSAVPKTNPAAFFRAHHANYRAFESSFCARLMIAAKSTFIAFATRKTVSNEGILCPFSM
jgi:hypothetical protein